MIPRTLEPEVMDTAVEAIDYDAMDHSEVNRRFAEDFASKCATLPECPLRILDVGTGTALIPIEIARLPAFAKTMFTGIDMAEEMLRIGRQNVAATGFADCIELERADAKLLPYESATFGAVISNSIIHHIPEPLDALAEMIRVLQLNGILFVRDLLRPDDFPSVDRLVAIYAGAANAHQQQMFRDSLCAALTLEEVREMLLVLNLPADWVMQTSDRHWTLCGRG